MWNPEAAMDPAGEEELLEEAAAAGPVPAAAELEVGELTLLVVLI